MPFSSSYSRVDRGLHYLAFATPLLQRVIGELESDLYRRRLEGIESRDEVFVAGLPRAGTTLLLELLYGTGEFATFTYRHMPFILAPLTWSRVARAHRKARPAAERAHGDGMTVSFESPEAFEEVVWLAYLKDRIVGPDRLVPLEPARMTDDCADALRASVRKLLALSQAPADGSPAPRYLSKNNANMSRIGVLSRLFPTATVLIAFREPAAHVASLDRQHRRFAAEHAEDRFSRQYMEWLGHYEFGGNLRPIDYDGWLGEGAPAEPDADFWTKYWCAAYGHALENATTNVRFVDFDRLLRERGAYLERIAAAVSLARPEALVRRGGELREPTTKPQAAGGARADVRDAARRIHARLEAAAI